MGSGYTFRMIFGSSGNNAAKYKLNVPQQNIVSPADLFELTGVKILLQILVALVSDAIKSSVDLFKKTVIRQNRHTLTSVVTRGAAKMINGCGSQIPMGADELQHPIIDRCHPVGTFTHTIFTRSCYTHRLTGIK